MRSRCSAAAAQANADDLVAEAMEELRQEAKSEVRRRLRKSYSIAARHVCVSSRKSRMRRVSKMHMSRSAAAVSEK